MSGMKREHVPQHLDGDSQLPARKLPRVAAVSILADDDASLPVSPTVAAGILPRSSRTPTPAFSSTAAVAAPSSPLAEARDRLARASDAHVQARLLQQLSSAAAAPSAHTNAAIDFLFSFLQSSQGDGADGARAGGGPVVVGAIVRGLRNLLRVKAAVVEPMIQVDAMGEQLMQCVSVAEDFKLRQDMLQIVVDCLMLTRAFAHVEQLLGACVRDHDAAMQAICVRGYVRLLDVGHQLSADPLTLFDLVATLLLHGSDDEQVKLWAVRLLAALSNAHPHLDTASRFFPGVDPSADSDSESGLSPVSLRDKAFFVLCMAASGAQASVRKEVALALREFGEASVRVVEHALQKAQISEEIEDDTGLKTVLMLSSGALLDLLEDKASEVRQTQSRNGDGAAAIAPLMNSVLLVWTGIGGSVEEHDVLGQICQMERVNPRSSDRGARGPASWFVVEVRSSLPRVRGDAGAAARAAEGAVRSRVFAHERGGTIPARALLSADVCCMRLTSCAFALR